MKRCFPHETFHREEQSHTHTWPFTVFSFRKIFVNQSPGFLHFSKNHAKRLESGITNQRYRLSAERNKHERKIGATLFPILCSRSFHVQCIEQSHHRATTQESMRPYRHNFKKRLLFNTLRVHNVLNNTE